MDRDLIKQLFDHYDVDCAGTVQKSRFQALLAELYEFKDLRPPDGFEETSDEIFESMAADSSLEYCHFVSAATSTFSQFHEFLTTLHINDDFESHIQVLNMMKILPKPYFECKRALISHNWDVNAAAEDLFEAIGNEKSQHEDDEIQLSFAMVSTQRKDIDLLDTSSCKVSCVYVFAKADTKVYLLICRRGVPGSGYRRIFTQGGAIDFGETAEDAAIREAEEESGIRIKPKDLKLFSVNGIYASYYVIYSIDSDDHKQSTTSSSSSSNREAIRGSRSDPTMGRFPAVRGPHELNRWEIIPDGDGRSAATGGQHALLGEPVIRDAWNRPTGWAWVEARNVFDHIKHEDYNVSHLLRKLAELGIFDVEEVVTSGK